MHIWMEQYPQTGHSTNPAHFVQPVGDKRLTKGIVNTLVNRSGLAGSKFNLEELQVVVWVPHLMKSVDLSKSSVLEKLEHNLPRRLYSCSAIASVQMTSSKISPVNNNRNNETNSPHQAGPSSTQHWQTHLCRLPFCPYPGHFSLCQTWTSTVS